MFTARSKEMRKVSKAERTKDYVNTLTPEGVVVTPTVLEKAEDVLKKPDEIFVRHIRSADTIMTEVTEDAENIYTEKRIVNGRPIATMVAFKAHNRSGEEVVYIGWAKRNQAKNGKKDFKSAAKDFAECRDEVEIAKMLQRYVDSINDARDIEISFHKKTSIRVAVMRALTDLIFTSENSSIHRTSTGEIVPRLVSKHLEEFIADTYRVFNGFVIENLVHELVDVA